MPDLDKFFEGCEIPSCVWGNAQADSKIEPVEVAEYSAIEQAICMWWLSNNKPLHWKIEHLQNGFEKLNIEKFFKSMLERHPQMYPSFHDIQLDLPGDDQAVPTTVSPAPHNITVEYAEKQITESEISFLKMLSTHIHNPEYVDRIAVSVSLDAATVLNIQAIYHNPKRAENYTEYMAYHILIMWYASSSETQVEKLCKLRDILCFGIF